LLTVSLLSAPDRAGAADAAPESDFHDRQMLGQKDDDLVRRKCLSGPMMASKRSRSSAAKLSLTV
jgi:hypothetical protein